MAPFADVNKDMEICTGRAPANDFGPCLAAYVWFEEWEATFSCCRILWTDRCLGTIDNAAWDVGAVGEREKSGFVRSKMS